MTVAVPKERETSKPTAAQNQKPKKIGVPKEIYPNECRVAVTPDTAKKLQKLGFEILIETGAGKAANFSDEAYIEANCQIVPDTRMLWNEAEIILKVRSPNRWK